MGRPSRLNVSNVSQNETWSPLHVTHIASGDSWAGAEVQLFHVAKQLAKEPGLTLDVILLNPGELEQRLLDAGITVTILDEARMTSLTILKNLIKHVKHVKPDLIHSHRRKENLLAAAAHLFGTKPACVSTIHSLVGRPEWFRFDQRMFNLANWFVLRFVEQCCIAVSGELGSRLHSGLGKQVRVIENGIDLENVIQASKARYELPEADGRIKVGIVARLVGCKRIDIGVEAAALLRESCPDQFDFFVFGDGPLKERIQQQIKDRGLRDTVHLAGFKDNLPAVLRQMNVMLMPSDHEGLPMALLEAMALGVPVVAHSVGGITNALRHGRAGWLVSEQNPEDYAEILQSLASDPEPFRQKAQHARWVIEEAYSSRKTGSEYAKLYRSLVKPRQ